MQIALNLRQGIVTLGRLVLASRHIWYSGLARKLARPVASGRLAIGILERVVVAIERVYPNPRLLRPLHRWILGGYIFRGYRDGLRLLNT